MKFQIIESSSAGNCSFLDTGSAKILIDAGVGVRKISAYLETLWLSIDDLDAVFVTHEHIDHYRALRSFKNYPNLKIFANKLTAETIEYLDAETKKLNWNKFETGVPFDFMGITVRPFSIPHDTSDAVGYAFSVSGKTLVWATDLGKITHSVEDVLQTANVLILECNYCPVMLDNSSRPYSLKQRIKNSHGHLSNADAITALKTLDFHKLHKVFLAHISRQCNSVAHIADLLADAGLAIPKIEIVTPCTHSSMLSDF